MKKRLKLPQFARLCRLLAATLALLLLLTGCNLGNPPAETTGEETTGSETTGEETTDHASKEDRPAPTLDGELISTLVAYAKQVDADHYDPKPSSWEGKIDKIKREKRALHVQFEADDYYYACAYFSPAHQGTEGGAYCCAEQYTWVSFGKESDILESYEGKALILAYQINRPSLCRDIVDPDSSVGMEHYLPYEPEFWDGKNVAKSVFYDETFVYIGNSDFSSNSNPSTVYHSTMHFDHASATIQCVCIEGTYYLWENKPSSGNFGKYEDALDAILVGGLYTVENGEYKYYQIAFEIDEFVNAVLQETLDPLGAMEDKVCLTWRFEGTNSIQDFTTFFQEYVNGQNRMYLFPIVNNYRVLSATYYFSSYSSMERWKESGATLTYPYPIIDGQVAVRGIFIVPQLDGERAVNCSFVITISSQGNMDEVFNRHNYVFDKNDVKAFGTKIDDWWNAWNYRYALSIMKQPTMEVINYFHVYFPDVLTEQQREYLVTAILDSVVVFYPEK